MDDLERLPVHHGGDIIPPRDGPGDAGEKFWEVDGAATQDHWLQLRSPDGWHRAVAKWDGCVDLERFSSKRPEDPGYDEDCRTYIHICDLDDFIARLAGLRDRAAAFFAEKQGGWPG